MNTHSVLLMKIDGRNLWECIGSFEFDHELVDIQKVLDIRKECALEADLKVSFILIPVNDFTEFLNDNHDKLGDTATQAWDDIVKYDHKWNNFELGLSHGLSILEQHEVFTGYTFEQLYSWNASVTFYDLFN